MVFLVLFFCLFILITNNICDNEEVHYYPLRLVLEVGETF